MARNVFISFRYSDGITYKNRLVQLFNSYYDTVDYSEDQDRSQMSEETIRRYLYSKLRRSSVTIILLTPKAVNHHKKWNGEYDDWMYDEIRFSLEDRDNNRTNGLVAVYTPEAESMLVKRGNDGTIIVNAVDNLFRKNMMNVKPAYKKHQTEGTYDRDYDSYCSLITWDEFVANIGKYVDLAFDKRNELYKYNIVKRM